MLERSFRNIACEIGLQYRLIRIFLARKYLPSPERHPDTKALTVHISLPMTEKVDRMTGCLERSRGWIVRQAFSA
jgi:hypothetical protein